MALFRAGTYHLGGHVLIDLASVRGPAPDYLTSLPSGWYAYGLMGRLRLVTVLVLLAFLPVYPLAFSTAVDPSFPGGFYDNGDLDDVIEFLCGSSAAVAPVLGPAVEPLWIVVASIRESGSPGLGPPSHCTDESRAPPAVPLAS